LLFSTDQGGGRGETPRFKAPAKRLPASVVPGRIVKKNPRREQYRSLERFSYVAKNRMGGKIPTIAYISERSGQLLEGLTHKKRRGPIAFRIKNCH